MIGRLLHGHAVLHLRFDCASELIVAHISNNPVTDFIPLLEYIRAREPHTAANYDAPNRRTLADFRELLGHKARIDGQQEREQERQARKDGLIVPEPKVVVEPRAEHPLAGVTGRIERAIAEHRRSGKVDISIEGFFSGIRAIVAHVWSRDKDFGKFIEARNALEQSVTDQIAELKQQNADLAQRIEALEKLERPESGHK
jgi:hypothetical protein